VNNLKCVECGQIEEPMLVFVKTMRYEDGTIEDLPEGMHPYCEPCREKLNITDELNAGRDLRDEAKQVTLDAVEEARQAGKSESGRDKGIRIINKRLGAWIGGMDGLQALLGRQVPLRPPEVFEGVSDAMEKIDPADMTISCSLALITITNEGQSKIPAWKGFVERCYQHYRITAPGRADKLLAGFR